MVHVGFWWELLGRLGAAMFAATLVGGLLSGDPAVSSPAPCSSVDRTGNDVDRSLARVPSKAIAS